jgi:hypothetical protein
LFLNSIFANSKKYYNIINREENDESRYRSKISEKLGLEKEMYKQL